MSRCALLTVLLTAALLAGAVTACAASPGVEWVKEYGDSGRNTGLWIEECSTGGYVVSGMWAGKDPYYPNALLMRLDEDGDTLYTRSWGGPFHDCTSCVRETSDKGFILVGYTETAPDTFDLWIIRTDAYGDTLWTRQHDFGSWEFLLNVVEMPGGDFISCGYGKASPAHDYDLLVFMFDEDGNGLWKLFVEKPGYERGVEICRTLDGNVAVAGFTQAGDDPGDIYLVKVDVANRDTLWTRTYPDTLDSWASGICEAPDGGLALGGCSVNYTTIDWQGFLMKTDRDGYSDWMKTFGGPGDWQYVASVVPTPDLGFALGARRDTSCTGSYDFHFIRTDALGDTLWTKTLYEKRSQTLICMALTGDYGYVSCGEGRVLPSSDRTIWLAKLGEDDAGVVSPEAAELPPLLAIDGASPFTENVRVRFDLPAEARVGLAVFDVGGRHVATIEDGPRCAGSHTAVWDCRSRSGERVTSGVYFIRCEIPGRSAVKKALVIR